MNLQDFDFRFWDAASKSYWTFDKQIGLSISCARSARDYFCRVLKCSEIELYTGFKDKNGVRIFENDIFKEGDLSYQVVRFSHNNTLIAKRLESSPHNFSDYVELNDFADRNSWEVVGNLQERK